MRERLIETPAVTEAVAHLEAFLAGRGPSRLWIVGPAGCGKSFLARWARERSSNGRRGALFDDRRPPETASVFAAFSRTPPEDPLGGVVVTIGPPEYERKRGVLEEWAQIRGLRWDGRALERLLELPSDDLKRLRGLAERAARTAVHPDPVIREADVLRALWQVGHLSRRPASQ